jgi:excisionase family DNA binding protein
MIEERPTMDEKETTTTAGGQQPELFTASDVARFCQVDLKTIHNWADKGEIRHFRTPGRHLRFRRLDVLDFLRKYGYPIPEVLRMGKPKVVVVDEDPAVLAALRKALSRRFELTTFQDAFDALVAVGNLQPDALILDVKMPGLDGVRCLERLRGIDQTAHIRCIVYSTHEEMKKPATEAGAYDFIKKGEVAELRDSLERLMGLERG